MAVSIRRLGPGDEPVLARLAADAADFDLAGRSGPDPPLAPDDAARYLADPSVLHWVAEDGGRVVGELLCHVLPLPYAPGRELLLYAIGVRDGERRRGVGTALVAELRRFAAEAGIAEAWVLADNRGAEAFYAACGFREDEEHAQAVMMVLDTRGR